MRDTNAHGETQGRHDRGQVDPWQREREREERSAAGHSTHDERAVSIMEQAVARWLKPSDD